MIRMYILAFGLSLFLYACSGSEAAEQAAPKPRPDYPVLQVSEANYTHADEYPAVIQGVQDIDIQAKVSGYVQEIYIDEGQVVQKGQALFKLETATLSNDAKAADAAIESAKARVQTTKLEVDKLRPLVEEQIISEIQLETAKANWEAAKAQLRQAESSYASIQSNIGYTLIKSPITGVVGRLNFRQGSLVGPSTARPLTTVAHIDKVYAYFSLNERQFLALTKRLEGNRLEEKLANLPAVHLRLADGSTYEEMGQIDASSGNIDRQTGAIQLRVIFDNPTGILRSGSSGEILLPKQYASRIAVPILSTYEQQGKHFVYVLGADDTLEARAIDIAETLERLYIVEKGLRKGEKILAQGANKLRPGMVINPSTVTIDSITGSYSTVFK